MSTHTDKSIKIGAQHSKEQKKMEEEDKSIENTSIKQSDNDKEMLSKIQSKETSRKGKRENSKDLKSMSKSRGRVSLIIEQFIMTAFDA